ncbi:MAG: ABC transporter permease [Candidatus Cloacimonadaceae bacterium]|nr:ABC transporter permease [Candidatus Cloacimonadaceae bacterium]MDP3114665.1 ABC transporter permease [Candidatus Cloacimonadaceae bacterium]
MNNTEKFFLSRYLKHPKRSLLRFSFVFMVLGIVLSVGILSAGLNLFEGYERALKSVLLDSFAHINVYSTGADYINSSELQSALTRLGNEPEIKSVSPVVSYSAMAYHEDKVRGAMLKGYLPDGANRFPFEDYVREGSTNLMNGYGIIGFYLAKELGLGIGDTLRVVYPQLDRLSPMGLHSSERRFIVSGLYHSGFYEFDRSIVICTVKDAQAMLFINNQVSHIEIRLKNKYISAADRISQKYDFILGDGLGAYPWTEINPSLFRLITMEKWLIFIIFSFLVLIAGINVISAVSALIYDKINEIAVLKTLGAPPKTIKRIMNYQISLVCTLSIIVGQLFGTLLSYLITKQSFYQLKGEVYFIDRIEIHVTPLNLFAVFLVASLLVTLCIRIPLRQIDRLQIMDLLRKP